MPVSKEHVKRWKRGTGVTEKDLPRVPAGLRIVATKMAAGTAN